MASVGQRDTGPEIKLRRTIHRLGLRYRLHDKKLPGSPDLVFPKYRAVIFVHGCFWHSHNGCKFATKPSTRKRFWNEKFKANQKRDRRNNEALLQDGWRVLIVWECSIKGIDEIKMLELGKYLSKWIKSSQRFGEIPNDLSI